MRKIILIFFGLLFFLNTRNLSAQFKSTDSPIVVLKEEQERFLYHLKNLSSDEALVKKISSLVESESNSIRKLVASEAFLSETAKNRAVKSYAYLLKDITNNMGLQKFELYDIPKVIAVYKDILKAFLHRQSITNLLKPLNSRQARSMANSFWEYDQSGSIEDMAVYKMIASSPEHILQFLKKNPGFRFADSLLFKAASHDAAKTFSYLSGRTDLFSNTNNPYMQEIISFSENKLGNELMPFIVPIVKKEITTDSILKIRMDVTGYFQLLVNTLKNVAADNKNPNFVFHSALRSGIKQKSLAFYVNNVNELHNSPDKIRFASVNALRPEDLYYIITSCEDELYTSSYLGLYRRLVDQLKDKPDSIFDVVNYDNFRIFMRMAANYNTLADFLGRIPQERAIAILKRFISAIETDTDSGLEKAMDVADSFTGLSNMEDLSDIIEDELKNNLDRCRKSQSFFGVRLYNILIQVFDLVKESDPSSNLWRQLGNYKILKRQDIQNRNGDIIEVLLFYGDDDGVSSFRNFLALFKDSKAWEITKNKYWVTIRSTSKQPVIIYANQPLDNDQDLDLLAQDSLFYYLEQKSLEPGIIIHRGHSYHLGKTLKRMGPSVKLALLGSCGGYNSIISVANISPDAHIIVSKKTGSKFINDPMIDEINETLLEKKDLLWSDIWSDLQKRFTKDEFKQNLFIEYIPPEKNVSLFVLKLFNSRK